MEIILNITTFLPHSSLNALTKTTKNFHKTLMETLYNTCSDPQSIFLWACKNNQTNLAKEMLSRGAKTRVVKRGPSEPMKLPLIAACIKGHVEMVRFLIDLNATLVNLVDSSKWYPLWWAIKEGWVDIVEILLRVPKLTERNLVSRAEDNAKRGGWQAHAKIGPLNIALKNGDMKMLNVLIEDGRMVLDTGSLLAAVRGGNVDCVKLCLQMGFLEDPGREELVQASYLGHAEIATLLLDHWQEPERRTRMKETGEVAAFVGAAMHGHEAIVRILLSRLNIEPRIHFQEAFMNASFGGHIDVMKFFLATGKVDINHRDFSGRLMLSLVIDTKNEDALRFLLSLDGIKPNERNAFGRTPLHNAAGSGVPSLVKILLDSENVDPEPIDSASGSTPFMAAVDNGVFLNEPQDSDYSWPDHSLSVAEQDILNLLRDVDAPISSNWMKHDARDAPGDKSTKEMRDTLEVMRVFLASPSVNPNLQNRNGNTVLFRAIDRRQVDAVQLLLSSGPVDLSIKDRSDRTALEYAEYEFNRVREEPCELEPYYGSSYDYSDIGLEDDEFWLEQQRLARISAIPRPWSM